MAFCATYNIIVTVRIDDNDEIDDLFFTSPAFIETYNDDGEDLQEDDHGWEISDEVWEKINLAVKKATFDNSQTEW